MCFLFLWLTVHQIKDDTIATARLARIEYRLGLREFDRGEVPFLFGFREWRQKFIEEGAPPK